VTYDDFVRTLSLNEPPGDMRETLVSLWWDRKGDWNRAHGIAQRILTDQGSAVHAYLHREEGVMWNADYWYRRAGRVRPEGSLEEEWAGLVREMLTSAPDEPSP
jgi:hypothetical protein